MLHRYEATSEPAVITLSRNVIVQGMTSPVGVKRRFTKKVVAPLFRIYYLWTGARLFGDAMPADHDAGNWAICPHATLYQAVGRLWPKDFRRQEDFVCDLCYSTFRRVGIWKDSVLYARRDLGHGGDVPDKYWLAAIGMQPRRGMPEVEDTGSMLVRVRGKERSCQEQYEAFARKFG